MRELKRRKRFASEGLDASITALEEQLADELETEDVPAEIGDEVEIPVVDEDGACPECGQEPCVCESDDTEASELIEQADALLRICTAGDEDDSARKAENDEIASVMREADALLKACGPENSTSDVTVSDDAKVVAEECENVEKRIARMESKMASETTPGIEDEIGDEAHGGDPSVSELRKEKVDCDTYKEVFPTNSEYVASITKRLDRVANVLEKKGMKRLAFRIDQLSDKLESSIK